MASGATFDFEYPPTAESITAGLKVTFNEKVSDQVGHLLVG
jgi:hypothetical protein